MISVPKFTSLISVYSQIDSLCIKELNIMFKDYDIWKYPSFSAEYLSSRCIFASD